MALDTSQFERGRRDVNTQWGAGQAANDFARTQSQQRFSRSSFDFKQNFGRQQAGFMSGQARRGLTGGGVVSGGFQQALQNRVGDYTTQVGRMNSDFGDETRRFDMEANNMDTWRNNALADIQAAKTKDISMTALNLQALKPLFS
jgi:hypothetical protein